jgi:hypothetical protein
MPAPLFALIYAGALALVLIVPWAARAARRRDRQ